MNQTEKILGIWNFFQKLNHNCFRKKAEQFLKEEISPESFPIPNPDFEKSTREQENWSRIYAKKAKAFVPFLRFLPGIKAVAYCNSVALGTADKESDIDLLIITAPGKLWTARIFATCYFQLLGMRRHGRKIAGRFCLSFFVTENALDFSQIALQPKDPYLAFWVSSLCPVFGEKTFKKIEAMNESFVLKSAGIKIIFNNSPLILVRRGERGGRGVKIPDGKSHIRNIVEIFFGRWFEKLIKKLFEKRAIKKRDLLSDSSGTIISDDMLKFHNTDRRREFLI